MTPSSPLRIGILGAANIAKQFARDVAPSRLVKIVAVASRTAETAAAFAAAQGIARSQGSYEALLADPDVDAIYLPLPNSLHAEWGIEAARAAKHVLCEKPLALSRADAQAMFDAAKAHGVLLLEGYPYWFQPQTGAMLAALGELGPVRAMQASFGFSLGNPHTNIRMKPELGGGALLDAGSYPLSLIRLALGRAPERVLAHASWSDTGVDISMSGTLFFPDDVRVQFSCAMNAANHRRAVIACADGTVETEYINHTSDVGATDPHGYLPSQLRVRRGTANTIPLETVVSPSGSGFLFVAEAFARFVAARDVAAVDRYASASVDIAATLEALALSARENRVVDVAASA